MSNSDSTLAKTTGARPHRRLSLTQPTFAETPSAINSKSIAIAPNLDEAPLETPRETLVETPTTTPVATPVGTQTEVAPTVRVMAYLSADEARVLDETWFKLRSHPSRPSKSDILRAACALAAEDFDALTKILSEQQVSTLSRQRSSKLRKNSG